MMSTVAIEMYTLSWVPVITFHQAESNHEVPFSIGKGSCHLTRASVPKDIAASWGSWKGLELSDQWEVYSWISDFRCTDEMYI